MICCDVGSPPERFALGVRCVSVNVESGRVKSPFKSFKPLFWYPFFGLV